MRSPRFIRESSNPADCSIVSLRHGVGLVALIIGLVFGFAPIAEAHTDFEFSDLADGSVITTPVSEIRVRFTAESLAAGDGFVVLTPTGDVVSPAVTTSADQREFTLQFDPPLVDGTVGVQWSVRAGDAHPIEGAFSFTTTAPGIPNEPEPDPLLDTGVDSSAAEIATGLDDGQAQGPSVDAGTVTLDEFLNVDEGSGLAGRVGFAGRLASQAGSLIAIGVVVFALLVTTKSPGEMRIFVNLVRQAGLLTIVGGLVESVGLVMSLGNVSGALFGSAGFAVLLRLVGAAGLVASTGALMTVEATPTRAHLASGA